MEDIRKGVCPLCQHNRIVRAWPKDMDEHGEQPMAVARNMGWLSTVNFGALYICTCQRCGFSQWFASQPERIPIDSEYETELIVGPEPGGPYR